MKPKTGEKTIHGHLYIVRPTLEAMLATCENCKHKAHIADMEYSNFIKHCKMKQDLRIDTYVKCASAFNKDVLLLHLPKGLIESVVDSVLHDNHRFSTIEHHDLIFILNEICQADRKRVLQHIIHFLHQIEETGKSSNPSHFLKLIIDFIHQVLERYGT